MFLAPVNVSTRLCIPPPPLLDLDQTYAGANEPDRGCWPFWSVVVEEVGTGSGECRVEGGEVARRSVVHEAGRCEYRGGRPTRVQRREGVHRQVDVAGATRDQLPLAAFDPEDE